MFKLLTTLNYFFVISITSQDPKLNALCGTKTALHIMIKRKKNTDLKIACARKIAF